MKLSSSIQVWLASGALFLASVACTFSLAEDITPPPGSELSEANIGAEELEFPSRSIDLDRGAEIFAESCAPCHGDTGLGDGPQADQLPFEVPAIGSLSIAFEPGLGDWYLQITNGNLDKFMPPFSGVYSVQERWDVLAFVIALSSEAAGSDLELQAINFPVGFGDLEIMAEYSGSNLLELLAGSGAITETPADLVSQAAITQFAKLLALGIENTGSTPVVEDETQTEESASAGAEEGKPESSETETEEVDQAISGQVVNGSGGPIPSGLEVAVRLTSSLDTNEVARAAVSDDGNFTVENFVPEEDTLYFFAVDVQGLTFFSNFYTKAQIDGGEAIEIEFFESSRDVSGLTVEFINLVFDFSENGSVQVIEQVIISNASEFAAAPGTDGDPLIFYELPDNASNLIFEQGNLGDRYFFEGNGFSDIRAVLPGENTYQMLFGYQLPYDRELNFELVLPFETRNVAIYLPEETVGTDEATFNFHGKQLVQNQNFDAYFYSGNLAGKDRVTISLDGLHPLEESTWRRLVNNDSFIIGLLSLSASVGFGWWWYRGLESGQGLGRKAKSKTEILDDIVALDERYEAGEISLGRYENRREKLKEALANLTSKKPAK